MRMVRIFTEKGNGLAMATFPVKRSTSRRRVRAVPLKGVTCIQRPGGPQVFASERGITVDSGITHRYFKPANVAR